MKIAIIGGGAAGCFAAANLAMNPSNEVLILEKSAKLLQKVRISGGGRCNATHACFEVPELIQQYPRGKTMLKKSLHHFGPSDTIDWFQKRGVELVAERDGRMFPITNDSTTIIDCLLKEMQKGGSQIALQTAVVSITKAENIFEIETNTGEKIVADKVIISTGGYPKLEHFDWLKNLGLEVVSPVPSLFSFNLPGHDIRELQGVALQQVTVKLQQSKLQTSGAIMITHWGLSGPAILRLSALAARELAQKNYDASFLINWTGENSYEEVLEELHRKRLQVGKEKIASAPFSQIPKRLWMYLLQLAEISAEQNFGSLTKKQIHSLCQYVTGQNFQIKGKTTYKEEFVTSGGIATSEVHPATMECKKISGLYIVGEALDVDGVTGGFNFQHAWCSAWLAAQHINSLS